MPVKNYGHNNLDLDNITKIVGSVTFLWLYMKAYVRLLVDWLIRRSIFLYLTRGKLQIKWYSSLTWYLNSSYGSRWWWFIQFKPFSVSTLKQNILTVCFYVKSSRRRRQNLLPPFNPLRWISGRWITGFASSWSG